MPASYRIDTERRTVFSRATGVLTDGDLLEHQRQLGNDPDFRPDHDQLFDFRGVTRLATSSAVVYALAEANPFGAGSRRAVTAPSDVVFGVARMFETLTSGSAHVLRLFRDHDAAMRWLGLQDSQPAQPAPDPPPGPSASAT